MKTASLPVPKSILRKTLVGALLLAAPAATTNAATVIYDNHVTASTVNDGRTNDPDYPLFIQHADDFSLPAAAIFDGVGWHGMYDDNVPHPDSFSLKVYNLSAGVPAQTVLLDIPLDDVARQDTGLRISAGLKVFSYAASFPDQTLAAGSYGLSIYNSSVDGVEWLWASAQVANGSFMFLEGYPTWRKFTGAPEFSFVLTQVPEPLAPMLLAMVVPAALLRRARPSRHSA